MTTHARNVFLAVVPPASLLLLVLIVWHVIVVSLDLKPYQLPLPSRVAIAAWNKKFELAQATLMTGIAAAGGFTASVILGTVVSILFSQSRIIARSVYPYAIFLQTVPIVAIAPLIINWLGTGLISVIVVSFIVSVFPIVTNTYAGLIHINSNLLDLFQLHNASRTQILVKLRLPNAVPSLILGARISAGLSVIGAIVGEFFAGATNMFGLGYLIPQAMGQLKIDYGFAAVICAALLGLAVFSVTGLAGTTILSRWQFKERAA
jgi:NitT/TauT family transport system permease protein